MNSTVFVAGDDRMRRGICFLAAVCFLASPTAAGDLDDLAKPHEGRSMRSTSTALDENGNYAHSNSDNSRVAPGATKVVLDAQGPGVITHMWFTFLGPEPHPWAKDGSANHQEILLRIHYDGKERPGVEAPLGDFFANSFGKRSEVISVPVLWRMPIPTTASGGCPFASLFASRSSTRVRRS